MKRSHFFCEKKSSLLFFFMLMFVFICLILCIVLFKSFCYENLAITNSSFDKTMIWLFNIIMIFVFKTFLLNYSVPAKCKIFFWLRTHHLKIHFKRKKMILLETKNKFLKKYKYVYIYIYIYIYTYLYLHTYIYAYNVYVYNVFIFISKCIPEWKHANDFKKAEIRPLFKKNVGGNSKIIIGLSVSSIMFQKSMKRAYVIK